MAYVISGFFAGLASIAYSAVFSTVQPGTGAGFELEIPKLFAQMEPKPLVIMQVHKVARNGGRLIIDTRTPFSSPISTPNNTETSIPAHVGHPQCTTR